MFWAISCDINQHYHFRVIIRVWRQINNILSCCDDQKPAIWEKHAVISMKITATSLRIIGNIHPNPNHLSESPHITVHNKRHEVKLYTWINQVPLKRNEILFCEIWRRHNHRIPMIQSNFDWNHNDISPNQGKHLSESSGTFSMHLSESCVRRILSKFTRYKQQCTSPGRKPIK